MTSESETYRERPPWAREVTNCLSRSNVCFSMWNLLSDDDRLDDKDSVDIHDNPPLPDNVVKEEDNTVRHRICTSDHMAHTSKTNIQKTDLLTQQLFMPDCDQCWSLCFFYEYIWYIRFSQITTRQHICRYFIRSVSEMYATILKQRRWM